MTITIPKVNSIQKSVRYFYIYRISSRFYFHLPILFPFLFQLDIGVFLTEVLLATYGLSITLASNLNVSTALLKYFKQKYVIATGEILKATGLLLIILGTMVSHVNFWLPLIGQVLGGIGFSIAISTDTSLLRSMIESETEYSFSEIQGQTQSYMFISTLVAGSIGGILFDYEAHWPFYASLIANSVAIASILLVWESEETSSKPLEKAMANSVQQKAEFKLDSDQIFWMNFYALSRSFTLAPFVGFIPFFFVMLGVDPYLFGAVLSLFSIGAFFSARYSNKLAAAFSMKFVMPIITGSMLVSMFLFSFFDYFYNYFMVGLIAIFLLGLGAGGVRPLSTSNLKLNSLIPQHRTKLLSSMERRFGILNACMLIGGSWLLTEYSFQVLMFNFAGLYILLLSLLTISRFLK